MYVSTAQDRSTATILSSTTRSSAEPIILKKSGIAVDFDHRLAPVWNSDSRSRKIQMETLSFENSASANCSIVNMVVFRFHPEKKKANNIREATKQRGHSDKQKTNKKKITSFEVYRQQIVQWKKAKYTKGNPTTLVRQVGIRVTRTILQTQVFQRYCKEIDSILSKTI